MSTPSTTPVGFPPTSQNKSAACSLTTAFSPATTETMATDGAGVRPFLPGLVKHAGTIHPGDPLTVESIPAQWAYTVSVPIELGHHQLPVVVSATVSVQEGTLGALVVAQDLTTVLARVPPSVRAGTHSLDVVVETLTPGARFVLRNTTPGNQRCLFT